MDIKMEISNKVDKNIPPTATYRQIPESDLEEEAVKQSKKSVIKEKNSVDGADEKMLPSEEKTVSPSVGTNEIKFTNNEKQNGDAKLEIGDVNTQYVGMSKEELMKYANDPFWVRLRWFLFIAFWVLWAAMLVGAVMIIVAAPSCNPPEPKTWWERGPLVELKEEINKQEMQELKNAGVESVIFSWFASVDAYSFFNDTVEYLNILKTAKDLDINVIVDLNPLSSNKWFRDSEGKDDFYGDYYIWHKSNGVNASGSPEPPNNWISQENRSSWIYSNVRNEFYYSPSVVPHLNFRNPNVVKEFSNILTTLINEGVKGVRLRGTPYLLVDQYFANESLVAPVGLYHTDYGFYSHSKTENLPEIGTVINQWRKVVKNKTENGPVIVAEDLNTLEPYKVNNTLVIDLPRHSKLFNSTKNLTSSMLFNDLKSTFTLLENNWPLWEQNNKAYLPDVMNVFISLLPGVPIIHRNESLSAALLKMRYSPSIMNGNFMKYELSNNTVFAYTRESPGNPGYLVAFNPTEKKVIVNFLIDIPRISQELTVQYVTVNYNETDVYVGLKVGSNSVPMSPESLAVFTYVPHSV